MTTEDDVEEIVTAADVLEKQQQLEKEAAEARVHAVIQLTHNRSCPVAPTAARIRSATYINQSTPA
jgi:hypothetical protein